MNTTSTLSGLIVASTVLFGACGGRVDETPAPPASREAMAPNRPSINAPAAVPVRSDASPVVGADTELNQLKRQVAHLRGEVAEMRQQIARIPAAAHIVETVANPRTDEVARQEAETAERLRVASSEAAFRREPADGRWSQGTTTAVQSALAGADESLRNQVRSIECRSQSCRIEIDTSSSEAMANDLPLVLARLGETLPNVTAGQIDQGDGRQSTVLYLSH